MDFINRKIFITPKITVSAKAWKIQVVIPHEFFRRDKLGKEPSIMNIYQILN